ncbi:hypothetical protein [Clostridium cylindrosporum]|uniref:Uncharacterized protein n=1 Tax=Clostridium cylindrosporum DSM 605 TaxID=1121307 RepID=A0A0J8DA37_CLOCY|nr:hypothetical protein [Clostridium cylindrosporum]KMT22915.1 hypothetical protein CLCY_5c01540 [Clostridium cylindrosporum DSM 605]
MSLYYILLNMILISIPEELVITLMTIMWIGRYDLLDRYSIRKNLIKIMIVVVVPCVVIFSTNIFVLKLDMHLRVITNVTIFSILMLILLKSKDVKKVTSFSLMVFVLIFIQDIITFLIVVYLLKIDVSTLDFYPGVNFLITLPERIIQYGIVYFLYLKKNALVSVDVARLWRDNQFYRSSILIPASVNLIILIILYNYFVVKRSLVLLAENLQLMIVVIVLALVALNIMIPWITLMSVFPKEKYKHRIKESEEV